MAELMDDVVHLAQEIGPHPAGTEEEQQAALYLAEEIQKESGFPTVIEDFQCVTNYLVPTFVCYGLAALAVIVSIVLPIATIPCFFVVAIAAVLFAMEIFQKPVLSRFLRTGASQNVVAKYQPTPAGGVARRRKVILVANYDTAKVLKEQKTPFAKYLPLIQKVSAVALGVATILLFFRMTIFATDTGAISSIITFLLVLCIILFVIPLVRAVLHMSAPYSESANNNAAGVTVLLDVAKQVGNGLVSNEEALQRAAQEGGRVHGEAAAREAGVVPEGASLEYDMNLSPKESLAAAKAAIAALTGKPVADKVPVTDISSRLVKGGGLEPVDEEAVSKVQFEVSETPKPRNEKQGRFRTMVSANDDNEPGSSPVVQDSPRRRVEEKELTEAAEQRSVALQAENKGVSESGENTEDTMNSGVQPVPSSFERSAPMAVVEGTARSDARIDRTPAWAKAAQEKARKNKPEQSQSHKVARSRYADTLAAHLMEQQTRHQQEPAPSPVSSDIETTLEQPPLSDNPELAARLALLRSEIESAEAPHITEEMQAALDTMEPASHDARGKAVSEELDHTRDTASSRSEGVQRETPDAVVSGESTAPFAKGAEIARQEDDDVQASRSADAETTAKFAVTPAADAGLSGAPVLDEGVDVSSDLARETNESDEGDALNKDVVQKTSVREAGHGISRSVRKAAGTSQAFASRLKSIMNRSDNDTAANDATQGEKPFGRVKAEPHILDDAVDEKDNELLEGALDEPVIDEVGTDDRMAKASSPSETAAISPIDVSQFMNKNADDEDDQLEDESIEDGYYDHVVYEPQEFGVHQLDAEKTHKVSSEQIQEAIQEANAREPIVSPREGDDSESAIASPIVGMESMLPQIPLDDKKEEEEQPVKRQVIVLPDVMSPHATSNESAKQRAPMAQTNESAKAGSKALLSNMLPRIGDTDTFDTVPEETDTFGLDLPPLGNTGTSNSTVSATGSFSTVGGTGSFAPVGDELVADIDPEERYIEDADDSAYDEDYTETGAYAGTGYVDMPKSRAGRLLGRFRKKKKKEEEVSVNDWVDVDDSYDARSVGKARGDWSSFRDEESAFDDAEYVSSTDDDRFVEVDYHETEFDNRRGWNGGAFSLSRLKKGTTADSETVPQAEHDNLEVESAGSELVDPSPAIRIDGDSSTAEQINRELRKLQDFRHPDIDTEVWFVALGAEQYSHSGINAFLEEHASELKGAVIVNLEALGAGTLSVIDQEGSYFKKYRPSSRIKRFVRQASERSGVTYHAMPLTNRDTSATVAMSRGVQAFTIAGMAEGNTALYSAANDIVENIDENDIKRASSFVMAILKSI